MDCIFFSLLILSGTTSKFEKKLGYAFLFREVILIEVRIQVIKLQDVVYYFGIL